MNLLGQAREEVTMKQEINGKGDHDIVLLQSEEHAPKATLFSGSLPLAGIRYAILPDGMTEKLANTFGLQRLEGIRQLNVNASSLLIRKGVEQRVLFPHDRWQHSLDVAVLGHTITGLIAFSCPQHDRRELRMADLLHDGASVALTDMVMRLDMRLLSEDQNLATLFHEAQGDHHVSFDRIDAIVNPQPGQTGLCEIHEWADRLAYVARDGQAWLDYAAHAVHPLLNDFERELKQLLVDHPKPCGMWLDLVRVGDKVACVNPDRLAIFLKLRVLLFRAVYFGEENQAAKCILWPTLERLWEEGKLRPHELRRMSDDDLIERILAADEDVKKMYMSGPRLSSITHYCASEAEADAFVEKLKRDGQPFWYKQALNDVCKPLLQSPVTRAWSGITRPFQQACPAEAREIAELATFPGSYRVSYLSD